MFDFRGKYLFILKELFKKDFNCFSSVNLDTIDIIKELEEKGLVEYIMYKGVIIRARISIQGIAALKNEIPDELIV